MNRVGLEVNSQSPLNLPRVKYGRSDFAEVCSARQPQVVRTGVTRITWLEVVEDVGELHCELQAHTFSDLDVLSERRIHVPSVQAT